MTVDELYGQANHRPWEGATGPLRVGPHTWFIGQTWIGVIVLETKEGLVIIDAGLSGQMWHIFESIRKLGYDPEHDIKLCLLSHCHMDHFSGIHILQNYSHPVVYMSEIEKEWPYREDLCNGIPAGLDYYMPFKPDRFFDYSRPLEFGGYSIECVLTPGHTPGTTSFFFEDTDEDTGRTYTIGMHGGLGLNTVTDQNFETAEEASAARAGFRQMLLDVRDRKVDISIANHPDNIHFFDRVTENKKDYRSFIDGTVWARQIDEKLAELDALERDSRFAKKGN